MAAYVILLLFSSIFSFLVLASASDTIAASESIEPGQTMVSAGEVFELGFFTPGNSLKQYVGVWYKVSNATIVWVANRENPVVNTPGILRLMKDGPLEILDSNKTLVWSSNVTRLPRSDPSARLLDSGNFVVTDGSNGSQEDILWQGFDYPCDTQLPDMRIGRDLVRKRDVYQSVWKSEDDPAEGDITFKLDMNGVPQYFLRKNSTGLFRSGPWNGLRFSGRPNLRQNDVYNFSFVSDQDWIYYAYEPQNNSVLLRTIVTQDGSLNRYIWNEGAKAWNLYVTLQTDNCDKYALCGAYAACNINNSPSCGCLRGFVPKSQVDWDAADWSGGCIRRSSLNCTSGDGFVKHPGVKVPDTRNAWSNKSMTLDECRISCLKNCSCTAYANSDIRDEGSGCLQWFDELIDIREYTEYGQAIFIRLASSEIGQAESSQNKRVRVIASSVSSVVVIVLGLFLTLHILRKRKQHLQTRGVKEDNRGEGYKVQSHHKDDLELPLFDLKTIAEATNHFSHQNKIGEGGFGPVYKGVLKGGQEIAVKRLSTNSNQGVNELMNEVMYIIKLQHRNLVRLLGCCIQEEKMLIYEYLGNKSLDFFIFDKSRSRLLDWSKRFNIINDIARGLLYLHQDSRLRIIHRDLKASNILLDYEMNAKISDFGMARSIAGNETSSSTTRVVGTYGYMSPEYAIDGLFSVKSDVFSYGVLVLEIITGRKNRGFQHPDHHLNLVGHAWRLFGRGSFLELIDESISDSTNFAEILRSVHVGLLCVQQRPEDRPSMANVVLMLSSEGELPEPKQPGFFTPRTPIAGSWLNEDEQVSTNGMSITMLLPR